MKYALLHCSYSAPVRVVDISDTVASVAARETDAARVVRCAPAPDDNAARDTVVVRGVAVVVVTARGDTTPVVAARDATGALRMTVDAVRPDAFERGVVAARDVADRLRLVVPVRPTTVFDDWVRDVFVPVAVVPERFVAFSSRTAALARPAQTAHINAKDRIFFISG